MNHEPLTINHSQSSFTLIEVMVVVGIIAILIAMLFPAVIGARERARKKQAMVGARNITLSLKAYRAEYGKWPNQTQATQDTTYVVDNHLVIQELIGYNPRGKIFLSIQTNMLDSLGNYVDPWGVPYIICMDENADISLTISNDFGYTNEFSTPEEAKTYSYVTNIARTEAGAASFGYQTVMVVTNISIRSWDEILH